MCWLNIKVRDWFNFCRCSEIILFFRCSSLWFNVGLLLMSVLSVVLIIVVSKGDSGMVVSNDIVVFKICNYDVVL